MKWPWHKRVKAAEASAERARKELEQTRRQWPLVQRTADELRRQHEMNGWTASVVTIFGAHDDRR